MLVVVSYDKRYNCRWQIIEEDGTVLASYKTRKEALQGLNERSHEKDPTEMVDGHGS